MKIKLKPCPCCGSGDVHVIQQDAGRPDNVSCMYCGLTALTRSGTEESIERWNKREHSTEVSK